MQHFYIYVLLSRRDKKLYIGYTNNLKRRLTEHANGEVKSTKNRRPLRLIHYEYFIDERDAKSREIFLKSGAGHKQLKDKLKQTFTNLS
ncbi:MAG: GIY-YIG nuclease family protein [Minisyncoccia bacterium]